VPCASGHTTELASSADTATTTYATDDAAVHSRVKLEQRGIDSSVTLSCGADGSYSTELAPSQRELLRSCKRLSSNADSTAAEILGYRQI
jgi:hypothetical protein